MNLGVNSGLSWLGLTIWRKAGRPTSVRFPFGSPFSSKVAVYVGICTNTVFVTLPLTINDTFKRFGLHNLALPTEPGCDQNVVT